MKTTLLISLICLASIGGNAQEMKDESVVKKTAVCKKYPGMPAGATAAWPSSDYISKVDPRCAPCYTYTRKSGLEVMECPGLWFLPEEGTTTAQTAGNTRATDNTANMDVDVNTVKVYSGNYPKVCKRDPAMPKGATPAWPKSSYTPTQDPKCAPCYTYTRKSGLEVMECPFLLFPPEEPKK